MACRPLKSIEFSTFTEPKEVLKAIENELKELSDICADTDFSDDIQRSLFERNVIYIKGYYERYERLLRDGTNGTR